MNEEMPALSLAHPRFETDLLIRRGDGVYVFILSGAKFYELDDEVQGLIALLDATDELVQINGVGMRRDHSTINIYDLRPAYLAKKQEEQQ